MLISFACYGVGPLSTLLVCDLVLNVAGETRFTSPPFSGVSVSRIERRLTISAARHNPRARAAVSVSYVFICERACDETTGGTFFRRQCSSSFGQVCFERGVIPEETHSPERCAPEHPLSPRLATYDEETSQARLRLGLDPPSAALREEYEVRRIECLPPTATRDNEDDPPIRSRPHSALIESFLRRRLFDQPSWAP